MPTVHSAQHGRLHERRRPTHDSVPWRRASTPWVVAATPDRGLLRAGSLGKHRGGPPARLYGRGGAWGLPDRAGRLVRLRTGRKHDAGLYARPPIQTPAPAPNWTPSSPVWALIYAPVRISSRTRPTSS